jgi:hypothetical protein
MIVSQTRETTAPSLFHDSGPALPRVTATPGRRRLDIPTIGVAIATYSGFILLTWFFLRIPILIAAPLGALLLTWYGSLQHETIHDHPTASRRINAMLAGFPLSLWLPYGSYRATHLQHHRHGGRHLADVSHDPESFLRAIGNIFSSRSPWPCIAFGQLHSGRASDLGTCRCNGQILGERSTDRLVRGSALHHHMDASRPGGFDGFAMDGRRVPHPGARLRTLGRLSQRIL